MADEKQLSAVRFFCRSKPSSKGNHDWSELVQQVSYFDFGHIQKDAAMIQTVARRVRKEFPNGEKWDKIVNAPGAAREHLDYYSQWAGCLAKAGAGECIDEHWSVN